MDQWKQDLSKATNRPVSGRDQRHDRSRSPQRPQTQSIPSDCIFDTFYIDEKKTKLRQELFYGCPENLAKIFSRSQMKPTALRKLYSGMQIFITPLKNRRIDFEKALEQFGIFYTEGIIRQNKRKVLPDIVVEFVNQHKQLILSSEEEMLGFFRYITSILCYFHDK